MEVISGCFLGTKVNYLLNVELNKIIEFSLDNVNYESDFDNSATYSIYIFFINNKGNHPLTVNEMKLYYFKIFDNNTLVRDYIPVLDKNKRPCLFDKVSKNCFYNQGDGEFLYG